jgi:DNA polymerase-1
MMNSLEKWKKALAIEKRVALIQARQELYGVLFDLDLAYDLLAELDDELLCIENKIRDLIHAQVKQVGTTVHSPFLKSGDYSKRVKDWYGLRVEQVSGPFSKIEWVPFNLNSSQQVKEYLLAEGWEPTTWNVRGGGETTDPTHPEKTSPKLTEDSYGSVEGSPVPAMIARYNVLKHRRNTICNIKNPLHKGWIANVRSDGRLEARAIPQATNTGRYRHSLLVNVPKASDKVPYGYQMRSLFKVPDGKLMLGCDASALEANMEAHHCYDYTGGHEYARELTEGDIHAKNAALFGTDRDGAKAPKYAMTYGAKPPKIAATLGVSLQEARQLYNAFWDGNTALAEFRDDSTEFWRRNKYVPGLDGRKIFIRFQHSIVNARFQSSGSIVVKVATLFFNKWIRQRHLDAHQIIHMHDEFQYEIWPKDAELLSELAVKAFEAAGKWLGIKVPITGEAKVGHNWAETH